MSMIEIYINDKKYTNIFGDVEWSGSVTQSARILEFEYKPEELKLVLGDKVVFKLDSTKELFYGIVTFIQNNSDGTLNKVTAQDTSFRLNKNRFIKNYFEKFPSEIVKEICGELELEVGKLPKDVVKCTFPAIDMSGYEIILSAYTIQHNKDKKIYSLVSNNGKIDIVEQGVILESVELNGKYDIRTAEYSEDLERMINQIVIYKTENDKAQILDKVANEEDKKKYGLFQDVMKYEEDMNNIFNAKDMLKGVEQTGYITVNGNPNLKSGYRVAVREEQTGLIGLFIIETDNHYWENGDYSTVLKLSFENSMNKIELDNMLRTMKKEENVEIKRETNFDLKR